MSCPVDKYKCPVGSNAEVFINDWNVEVNKDAKWTSSSIRNKVYCKLHIKANKVIEKDRWTHNNMEIKIREL